MMEEKEEIKKDYLIQLKKAEADEEETEKILWEAIKAFQGNPFLTVKGCAFTYIVKGNEIKISRKEKTITRSTVKIALKKALELKAVRGPKSLGVFGASYLYPLFLFFGVIKDAPHLEKDILPVSGR